MGYKGTGRLFRERIGVFRRPRRGTDEQYLRYSLFMVRRVGETVHARHYDQYEREVEETRDCDYDEHFVGRVAHARRRNVLENVRRRRPSRAVAVHRCQHDDVVPMMVPMSRDGLPAVRASVCAAADGTRVWPSARRRSGGLVVLPVVTDDAPIVTVLTAVVVHRDRSTVTAAAIAAEAVSHGGPTICKRTNEQKNQTNGTKNPSLL